jgi:metal-sulfur cluster biosynthetic enzyme
MQQITELPFAYEGPDDLRLPIMGALARVVDPELALSIVDVGLVYSVSIDHDKASVRMTMTSPACPVIDVILEDVENELDAVLPHAWPIEIELVWEPPWAPERMSARARRFMQW